MQDALSLMRRRFAPGEPRRISVCGARRGARGFTIFEILLSLLIISLLFGFTLKAVRSSFDSEGRRFVQRLQGTIKFLYNQAALDNRTYRLLLTFAGDDGVATLKAQVSSDASSAEKKSASDANQSTSDASADGKSTPNPEPAPSPSHKSLFDTKDAKPNALSLMHFDDAVGNAGPMRSVTVPKSLVLREVRTPGKKIPVTEGDASVYFYPGGFMDKTTLIFSNDKNDHYFVLTTNPLTGFSRITRKYPDAEETP